MKVLTYTLYKEYCQLYTVIRGSIAVSDCQIGLFKKDKILLEDKIFMKHSKSSLSGTFDPDNYFQLTFSSATYSIDGFNGKIKAAVLRQKKKNETHLKSKT